MRWFEVPAVLTHIIDCYAGTENTGGRVKRQFLWEEPNGDLVIGNSRAFADHLAEKFGLAVSDRAWMGVHEALRELGEVVQEHSAHQRHPGRKFHNQLPEVKVVRRGGACTAETARSQAEQFLEKRGV